MIAVVDENDNVIGYENKEKCHLNDGILHRAFLLMFFNDKNELLLTKRSELKKLWPGFWDGSVASHARKNETYEEAAKRRLKEELGIKADVKKVLKFRYFAKYFGNAENEICALLICRHDGKINLNKKEISEGKFIELDELKENIIKEPEKFTPWLKIALNEFLKVKK